MKKKDEGYFLKEYVQYLEKLHDLQNDSAFLPQRMKIEKLDKLFANAHDKTEYVVFIRNLKQALNHGLVLKKVHRVIKLNQKALLKRYININTKLKKKKKHYFDKDFFKLMNNSACKTMKNVRKHRDIKLVTTEKRKKYLVSELNYHTTKFFTENILAIAIKKAQILINKSIYLVLSALDLSKIAVHEFWWDYVKAKCGEKAKFCHMDTDSFIAHLKINCIYKDIKEDVETRFETSHCDHYQKKRIRRLSV